MGTSSGAGFVRFSLTDFHSCSRQILDRGRSQEVDPVNRIFSEISKGPQSIVKETSQMLSQYLIIYPAGCAHSQTRRHRMVPECSL
jgi:hypothetical protein